MGFAIFIAKKHHIFRFYDFLQGFGFNLFLFIRLFYPCGRKSLQRGFPRAVQTLQVFLAQFIDTGILVVFDGDYQYAQGN